MASLPLVTRLKLPMLDLITYLSTRRDGTTNRRLFRLIDTKTRAPATRRINKIQISTSDITIDPSRKLWLRHFTPTAPVPTSAPLPLIIYFHGGGFTNYGPDTKFYDHLCTHLSAAVPAVVASVNYRLTPDHKLPSQYEDGLDALRFIDAELCSANTHLTKCFIGGDSAGGNIAHHVIVRALEENEQFGKMRIIGMVGVQPFFGGEERSESEVRLAKAPVLSVKQTDDYWRLFLPEGADRDHPAVNVFGGGGDAVIKNVEFPASLVIVGGNDPLRDWGRRYVEWLKGCGKRVVVAEYPNAFHAFYAFPELPEFALLIRDVASFVREQVTESAKEKMQITE